MKKELYEEVREKSLRLYEAAGIVLREDEAENLEVADFGLNDVYSTGLSAVVYVNTPRCCAKEMALLPRQTCPEHRHAPIESKGYPGKEETFRCRFGEVYLFVEGERTEDPKAAPPQGEYTVFHQVVLKPGEQYTLQPDTLHWFQAGPEGAVVSEFSTASYDECDLFTDPRIQRIPVIEG